MDEKFVAVLVKSRDAQAGHVGPAQLFLHPLAHFLRCVLGISDGEDFVGPGMPFADQVSDAPGENGSLARARAGDDQHWAVDMFDRFALALVRLEHPRT